MRRCCYTLLVSRPVPIRHPATYGDLQKVPDHMVAEILDGDLYATPRPAIPHAIASSRIGSRLGGAFDDGIDGPGGWWILAEPELHLAGDILVADLTAWRRTRVPDLPRDAFLTISPDWVCEIVSPSTEHLDRGKKLAIYARERVPHAWLVNPLSETLEPYRLDQGRWVLLATHAGDISVHIEPFDAVAIDLWRLWGRSEPR